jgi:hypothetical protein
MAISSAFIVSLESDRGPNRGYGFVCLNSEPATVNYGIESGYQIHFFHALFVAATGYVFFTV